MKLKNRKIKSALLLGLAALTVVGSVLSALTPVLAEGEVVYSDYDASRTGSITLYKYVNNDGTSVVSDGTSYSQLPDENLEGVQNATGSYRMIPEKGVEFAYYKIADFEQVTTNSTAHWYVTDIKDSYKSLLESYGIAIAEVDSNHYEVDDVVDAHALMCKATNGLKTGETALRELTSSEGTAFPEATNYYGKTKAENLPAGLYLVSEINWEHQSISKYDTYWSRIDDGTEDAGEGSERADIVSPASPFLVQLPIAAPDGSGWIYTVSAYPKNSSLTIHKDIVVDNGRIDNGKIARTDTYEYETPCDYAQHNYINSDGDSFFVEGDDEHTMLDGEEKWGLTHQMDVMIGETVTQVISVDLPKLVGDRRITTYTVSDRMTEGLNFTGIRSVSYGAYTWDYYDWGNDELTEGTDYAVNVGTDNLSFSVELTESGLNKINSIDSAGYFYVLFDSVMTKSADIGTATHEYVTEDGSTTDATNQNTAKLTFSTDRTGTHDYYSNTTRVYTYEIDLTKTLPGSSADQYGDVQFQIERYCEPAPAGPVSLLSEDTTDNYELITFVQTSTDADGTAVYMPDETGDTVVSPGTNGKLRLVGVDSGEFRISEIATASGFNLLTEPMYLKLEANKVSEGYDEKYENGALIHAYAWTGKEPFKLSDYDILKTNNGVYLSEGIVKLTVQNNSIINMLRTGGNGTTLITVVGAAAILMGVIFLVLDKKKESEEDNHNA